MKKLLILAFIILATTQFAFAQQAIAKIKYEEAEEAYAANNFELTVTKLNEVEAILKSTNPRVMYLRIMAQSSIIEYNPFNDYNIIANTRKLCAKYLKDYENVPNNEDKYRDIYKKSEALNTNYPATLDEFNKKAAEKHQQLAQQNGTICAQLWATKNLDVSAYCDGTPIPQVTNNKDWKKLTTGAWCYYNNDPANGAVYGKLYNWYAEAGIYDEASLANPALRKKLAPSGWHIPTDAECTAFIECLGGEKVAPDKMKEAGTAHWASQPNIKATNSSGFTALPGGFRYYKDCSFCDSVGYVGDWWSSTEFDKNQAWRFRVYSYSEVYLTISYKKDGYSVRCVRD
jgi:uncharacterized protein (TIGR02145 family)